MPRWSAAVRGFALLMVAAAVAPGGRAQAAADLSGAWRFANDVFMVCEQAGTAVTCQWLPSIGLTTTGTIDPDTGAFSFPLPPVPVPPGSPEPPPGPDGSFTGTVAVDGQSLDGTLTLCQWIGDAWLCSPIAMDAVRFTDASVCGNGIIEPGETCDQGTYGGVSANGDQCCASDCQLVDPDGDLFCSRFDNCPLTVNVDQTDTDRDGIGDACEPDGGGEGTLTIERLRTRYSGSRRGMLSVLASYDGTADAPWFLSIEGVLCGGITMSDFTANFFYQALWRDRLCRATATMSKCAAQWEDTRLLLTVRRRGDGTALLKLKMQGLDFCSPGLVPPARLTIVHGGGVRVGATANCVIGGGDTYKSACRP